MKPRFSAGLMIPVMMLLLSQTGCSEMSFMTEPKISLPWQKKSVSEIAQGVTVIIDRCSLGSGVIFQKDGNTYSVLTARHVVSNDVDCLVITPDGEKYPAKANKFKVYEGLDLAVMQFESPKDYPLGELEKSEKATLGQKIFIAGAPIPNETIKIRTLRLSDGTIISTPSEGTLGRTLVYSNSTKAGMSGGPVLDEQGRVIGIHTAADPKDGGREAYGIPILKFLTGKVSQKPKDQDADTYLSKGLALAEKGDYQGAITNFDQAIKLNPNFAEAYLNRGAARSDLGDKQGAIADDDQAIKLNPNLAGVYYNRGNSRFALGDKQGAIADLDQAIKLNPNEALYYFSRGTIHYRLGNYQSAIADLDQGIKLNPNDANAYNNRGGVRFNLGDKQGAIADFDQAINLNPNDANAYNNRGGVRFDLGDKQGAIADFDQAINLNPNDAEAYFKRGVTRSDLGDKQGEIADYDQAIKLNPNYANAYFNRGVARYKQGGKQAAIADFNQAIKLNPNYANAYSTRGVARSDLGDKQGGIKDLQKAADLFQQQGNQEFYKATLDALKDLQGQ